VERQECQAQVVGYTKASPYHKGRSYSRQCQRYAAIDSDLCNQHGAMARRGYYVIRVMSPPEERNER
jgi:hypothetical protein